MKIPLERISTVAIWVVVSPFLVFLLVAVSPIIIGMFLLYCVSKFFSYARKDPIPKMFKTQLFDSEDTYPTTTRDLEKMYMDYISKIAKVTNASIGEVTKDGFAELNDDSDGIVSLRTKLIGRHGAAEILMDAVDNGLEDDRVFYSANDGDRPPYLEVIYSQNDGMRTRFDVSHNEQALFLIATLKSGQELSNARQVWTKISNNVYMVNYSIKKSNKSDRISSHYGYRTVMHRGKAREYFFDQK